MHKSKPWVVTTYLVSSCSVANEPIGLATEKCYLARAKQTIDLMTSSDKLTHQQSTYLILSSPPPPLPSFTHTIPTVTVIVTAKKELRRVRRSHNLRSHRFEINKILRGAVSQSSSNPLNKKSLRAVIMESNDDNTTHLKVNNKYILNGRMANDILYVSGPQYMHQYSAQLENHIQSC